MARGILTALTMLLCLGGFAHAKRVALVIGNDNYTAVSKLQKAGNDAEAMARELRAAGFTVQLQKDLNYRSMVRVVDSFINGITGGDEVVVFFSGHGLQIKSGSYLLPTDIEADNESQVEKTAYGLNDLTEKLSEAKAAFALVIIDACRDNPLRSKGRNIGAARGLSAVEPAKGQMIVYSASRGQQALDRLSDRDPNPNGVFTREFIARMKKPGVRIEDMVREVQDAVETLAKTVSHAQRPALYNEARGNFYFYGPTTVQVAPQINPTPGLTAEQREDAFWNDAKAVGNKEAFEGYLEGYPKGRYVSLAKANITRLSAATNQIASAPVVTQTVIRPQPQAPVQVTTVPPVVAQPVIQPKPGQTPVEAIKAPQVTAPHVAIPSSKVPPSVMAIVAELFKQNLYLSSGYVASNYSRSQTNQCWRKLSIVDEYEMDLKSTGTASDFAEAVTLCQAGHRSGHPEATSNIGLMYHYGLGFVKNITLAKEWYLKSLAMNAYPLSPQSEIQLGFLNIHDGADKEKVLEGIFYLNSAIERTDNGYLESKKEKFIKQAKIGIDFASEKLKALNVIPCIGSHWDNCEGVYVWPADRGFVKYIGEFKENAQNGRGTYIWPNGEKYIGGFRANKMYGQGVLTRPDGSVIFSGMWDE